MIDVLSDGHEICALSKSLQLQSHLSQWLERRSHRLMKNGRISAAFYSRETNAI